MRLRSWAARFAASLWLACQAGTPAAAQDMQIPVPRAVIYPGVLLTDELLVERAFAPNAAVGVISDRADLVGKIARITLLPGQPIGPGAVREEPVVKQGKPVRVVFESGGLVISTIAVALQAGVAGDMISLRNTDSGVTIKGAVQADGTVRVGLP